MTNTMQSVNSKSTGIAYLLWFLFGSLGAHRFYLGKTKSALIELLVTIVCGIASIFTFGISMIIPIGIYIVDAFLIPGLVREANATPELATVPA